MLVAAVGYLFYYTQLSNMWHSNCSGKSAVYIFSLTVSFLFPSYGSTVLYWCVDVLPCKRKYAVEQSELSNDCGIRD